MKWETPNCTYLSVAGAKSHITKEMARNFMNDLRCQLGLTPQSGVMSAKLVAEHLKITEEKANAYLWAAVRYGYSDRSNGMFVI